jgi:hypothetical protein
MPNFQRSSGLLLAATKRGELDTIQWTQIDAGGGLLVTVSNDALKARIPDVERPIRLPASYAETIEICNLLGYLPPTQAVSDAIWAAAAVIVPPRGLVRTSADAALMNTVAWTIKHNDAIDTLDLDPALLVADVGKDWILDNGISVLGAVNYGWRVDKLHLLQPLGHAHNAAHWDYSQVLRAVQREAVLNGTTVDLLDYLLGTVEEKFLAPYRG